MSEARRREIDVPPILIPFTGGFSIPFPILTIHSLKDLTENEVNGKDERDGWVIRMEGDGKPQRKLLSFLHPPHPHVHSRPSPTTYERRQGKERDDKGGSTRHSSSFSYVKTHHPVPPFLFSHSMSSLFNRLDMR